MPESFAMTNSISDIIKKYIEIPSHSDNPAVAEIWREELDSHSISLDSTKLNLNQKKKKVRNSAAMEKRRLFKRQKRIARYQEQLEKLNICIDALRQHGVLLIKKSQPGVIMSDELFKKLCIITELNIRNEQNRDRIQAKLIQLA